MGKIIVFLVTTLLASSVAIAEQIADAIAQSSAVRSPDDTPLPAEAEKKEEKDESVGMVLPHSEQMRIVVLFLAGYGQDLSQASLGLEKQGSVGYLRVKMFGKLNSHFSYVFDVNPVNDNQPGVACGEKDFFFPNTPQDFGPKVVCDNNGRLAVDDYRFRGLDPVVQQKFIREAYLLYNAGPLGVKFGQFQLKTGFDWEKMGFFTAKDAPHITRINAEMNFGVEVSVTKQLRGREFASISLAGVSGDGNRYHDYDYFYWIDSSDTNSWQTVVLSGSVNPIANLDIRVALKRGDTGSKVERLPNFFASKRNDNAVIMSARWTPHRNIAVFGEKANYTWGLKRSSAEMLGLDPEPVKKNGYYIGADLSYPVMRNVRIGTVLSREELDRDDALVKYMAETGQYGVELGKKERSTAVRFYTDIMDMVRVGFYYNKLSNPYPWLSGIAPVSGERAFQVRGNNKWGVIVNFTID